MSTTTLQFKFKLGGVLTDATSVLLSDSTGTYGVRRTDTNATVVADGTAMTHVSTGVYEHTFTDPAAGLTYQWVAEVLHAGNTSRYTFTATGGGGTAYEGRYTTETAIDNFLNSFNTTAYADLNNDDVRDTGAVQQAIVTAEGRVDFYTGGPFSFSDDTNGEVAESTFERWARVLATWELYAKRVPMTSDAGAALTKWKDEAIAEMKAFAGGEYALPGATPLNPSTLDDGFTFDAPEAIAPTVNPDGTPINTPYPYLMYSNGRLTYG